MTASFDTSRGSTRLSLAAVLAAFAVLLCAVAAQTASASASWSKYPVPRPANSPFEQPLGTPSDLSCWSADHCVLLTMGDARSFSNGLFAYAGDPAAGSGWKQYATVCGAGNASETLPRVVWAAPDDFWVITTPSSPWNSALNLGVGLCHFKAGQVIGSYSTVRNIVDSSSDPYRQLDSGACLGPDNCWFGGVARSRPDGTSPGTFHLHWNGTALKTVYAPAKRGASDIAAFAGGLTESVFAGPDSTRVSEPSLLDVPAYRPIQTIAADAVDADGFAASSLLPDVPGFTPEATEILALDSGTAGSPGAILWAVGGGAASGPQKDLDYDGSLPGDDSPADTGPFAAWRDTTSSAWHQLAPDPADWSVNTRFVDVAAIPGTTRAIAAVRPDNEATIAPDVSTVAMLDAADGSVTPLTIGTSGSVLRVECASETSCWAATTEGWILRLADPAAPTPLSGDPAFAKLITARPNEVAEQALTDSSEDDSQLFAPAPEPEVVDAAVPKKLKPAVGKVKTRLRGSRLIFSFKTIRKARITIQGKLHGRVVAEVRSGLLRPGRHRLTLRLNKKRWPTKIAMKVTEPKKKGAT